MRYTAFAAIVAVTTSTVVTLAAPLRVPEQSFVARDEFAPLFPRDVVQARYELDRRSGSEGEEGEPARAPMNQGRPLRNLLPAPPGYVRPEHEPVHSDPVPGPKPAAAAPKLTAEERQAQKAKVDEWRQKQRADSDAKYKAAKAAKKAESDAQKKQERADAAASRQAERAEAAAKKKADKQAEKDAAKAAKAAAKPAKAAAGRRGKPADSTKD
ncbi:hypothetical protein EIP91_002568 [Steccherinum ochraceum]|uniref:Uncharacterized protein n=1 Tax=Steccherinum ochraceum TaxID=92696 RepID=A0A4R0RSN0_9APHY|nr:hypothetical protein EIP91_002568 [Steccherinum ochraceum]